VFDFHDLRLSNDLAASHRLGTRFASGDVSTRAVNSHPALLSAQCHRIVVSCSLITESKARTILSVGPLTFAEESSRFSPTANDNLSPSSVPLQPLCPRLIVNQLILPPSASARSTLALNIDIPSVCVDLTKPTLDALQYWVDDVGQLMERIAGKDTDTEAGDSRDTSLIGSRFFAKSLRSKSSGSGNGFNAGRGTDGSEIVIQVLISEGCTA
jgi:autophagy-related protein 2